METVQQGAAVAAYSLHRLYATLSIEWESYFQEEDDGGGSHNYLLQRW